MIVARAIVAAGVLSAWAGCHNPACPEVGIDAGERFQITIVARRPFGPACEVGSLEVGDTLTIVAGGFATRSDGCGERAAEPTVPAFAGDLVSMCEAKSEQLGQRCRGSSSPTTWCWVDTFLGPQIKRSDQILDGVYTVSWAGTCAPNGGCTNQYDVHVERLPPG